MKATQTAQHTPWYAADMGNDHQGLIVSEQDGRNIAVTYDKDDAPKIVRAVNCHDELLAALVACKEYIGTFHDASSQRANTIEVYEQARAAIAKAANG